MMRKPRILLDVDEVVCDFVGYYLKLAEKLTNRKYNKSQVTQWSINDALDLPQWARREIQYDLSEPFTALKLQLLPGAKEAYRELSQLADVHFATVPYHSSKTWGSDRVEWLKLHFGENVKWHLTENKYALQADVMVDDKAELVDDWATENPGLPIIWDCPWNSNYKNDRVLRLDNWTDIISVIEKELEAKK